MASVGPSTLGTHQVPGDEGKIFLPPSSVHIQHTELFRRVLDVGRAAEAPKGGVKRCPNTWTVGKSGLLIG